MSYYIYAYISKRTGLPYYIGKGTKRRAFVKHHKGIPVPNEINRIIIMERQLTNIGAIALERFYIKWYGRRDLNNGILLNRTDGGEGGDTVSNVTRKLQSVAKKGKPNPTLSLRNKINPPRKGTLTSDKTKQLMSESKTKNPTRYWLNKSRDMTTREKIAKAKMGKKHSDEHRRKNSEKIKQLWQDPIWKEQMLKSRKDKKNSIL